MSFLNWLERLVPERRSDALAKQLHREVQALPDSEVWPFIERVLADSTPPTEVELRALVDVLCRLPPRQRAVLEMSIKGLTPKQIAAELGVSHSVAIKELAKAMGAVRMEWTQ